MQGRTPTLFALALLVSLSFILILTPFTHPHTATLRKRDSVLEARQQSNTSTPSTPTSGSSSSLTPSLTPTSSRTTPSPSFSSTTSTSSSSSSSFTAASPSSIQVIQSPPTLPPSTTPTSSSSSSSQRSRSSESQSLALTGAPPAITHRTTLVFTPTTSTNTEETSSSESPTAVVAAAAGFWANKSAVAGTFSVVGLFIVGVLIALGTVLVRKRNLFQDEDTYFEKYSEQGHPAEPASPGPSVTDLNQTPMNAYPSNDVHYDNSDPHLATYPQEDPVGYPPGTAYAHATTQEGPYQYHSYGGFDAAPAADYSQPSSERASPSHAVSPAFFNPTHPYSNSAPATGLAPPVAFREPLGRDSGYQQSIDSFYGASTSGQAL